MKELPILIWFRNDLRISDNELIYKASKHHPVIPVFCWDENWNSKTSYATKKMGHYRKLFLLECILDLKNQLKKLGSDLLVLQGNVTEQLSETAIKYGVKKVYVHKAYSQEEIDQEIEVEKKVWKYKITMEYFDGSTLLHPEDLPFTLKELPDVFTVFRKKVEKELEIRPAFNRPEHLFSPEEFLKDCKNWSGFIGLGSVSKSPFVGGELEAIKRLNYYFYETQQVSSYKTTRNQLLGIDYSTKFSPYLAAGCISARSIYHELKKYESICGSNESTYWVFFELLWRDYFKFLFKKHGNAYFKMQGLKKTGFVPALPNENAFEIWKKGLTGVPFVDASMRELMHTGFMSNRGRQNVASYLIHDLGVPWLYGAHYFEEMLVDYDVCSNYGNWAYIAGVGNDPRENRRFNVFKQAKEYDPDAAFMRYWLPELQNKPKNFFFEDDQISQLHDS